MSAPGLAQPATVKPEVAGLRAAAKPGATVVAELKRGESVVVEVSIGTSDSEWCYLRTATEPPVSGYLRCDDLDRGRRTPAIPVPMAELPPVLTDADLARLECNSINFRGWMARYEFAEDQLRRADQIADETGLNECAAKASPFVRRYSPASPLDRKLKLMREWAAVDPSNSCLSSWRRFWAKIKPLMTEEQRSRLQADLPAVSEAVARVHGDIKKCVPLFCFF